MKLWLIFVQGDDHTWLEAAWDDEMTAENNAGWQAEVDRVKKMVAENREYEMVICETTVAGVYDLFDLPKLEASKAEAAE